MKIIVLSLFIVFLLFLPVSHSWWDSSWGYRRQVDITENSGNSLTNYPINVTENTQSLITEGKMKSDCSDIRLINETSGSELSFSILGCDSTNTVVTTKVNLTASQTADDIYIYYGNSDANSTNISFNDAYYELWDDFTGAERSNPNTSKWVEKSWYDTGGDTYISNNQLNIVTSDNWARPGIYSIKNFSTRRGWEISVSMLMNSVGMFIGEGVYYIKSYFINSSRINDDIWSICVDAYPSIEWRGNWYYVTSHSFRKCNDTADVINFGNYTLTIGWHTYRVIMDYHNNNISSYYDGTFLGSTDYSSFTPQFLKFVTLATSDRIQNAYLDDVFIRRYTDPEPTTVLGLEEKLGSLHLSFSTPIDKHIFINKPLTISTTVNYDNLPLTRLSESNFKLSLDEAPLSITTFTDNNDGSYLLTTIISSKDLGLHTLKIQVNYQQKSAESILQTNLLTEPKDKVLIITDEHWQNYIPAVSSRKPVLVYNSDRNMIDHFIPEYNPQQIFQLGTNLDFPIETFNVDIPETLIKLFFKNSDIVIPSNKETTISTTMLNLPILLDPSQDTLDYIDPDIIHRVNSLSEIEELYLEKNPQPDYFILTNPNEENSMFASVLAMKKNGFVVQSIGNAEQARETLREKVELIESKSSSGYLFSKIVYLALVDVPRFSVEDLTDGGYIKTDTPYGDVNGDKLLDFSLGRFVGTPEQISYQIEQTEIFEPNKKALVLVRYNVPKFQDLLAGGGSMMDGFETELALYLDSGFQTTRLIESRASFTIDENTLGELNEFGENLKTFDENTYGSLFSTLLSGVKQIGLVFSIGQNIIYSINEFNWVDAWRSIIHMSPQFPERLPTLTSDNLLERIDDRSVVVFIGDGDDSEWFFPSENFSLDELPFNPAFYFLIHSDSYYNYDELLEKGMLGLVGSTSSSNPYFSGSTARMFFENFDEPVGRALFYTNNKQLGEFNEYFNNSVVFSDRSSVIFNRSKTLFEKSKFYLKEYYTKNLVGDPSLRLDPRLELFQSETVKENDGVLKLTFTIKPDYLLVTEGDKTALFFKDADDFLNYGYGLIIPQYEKLVTLPSHSEIIHTEVKVIKQSIYRNISFPPQPEDPTAYDLTFPGSIYYSHPHRLLDDRIDLDFSIAPVIYSLNGTAVVFDELEITVTYKSPIEITSISTQDIFKGNKAKISFEILNNFENDITINTVFRVDHEEYPDFIEFEKEFTIHTGTNKLSIDWTDTENIGPYSVGLALTYEDIAVGPKYTTFTVKKQSSLWDIILSFLRKTMLIFTGFSGVIVTPKDSLTFNTIGDKTIIDYMSWNVSLHIENTPQSSSSVVKHNGVELKIEKQSLFQKYELESPEGVLVILNRNGKIEENGSGNIRQLRVDLNRMLDIYEQEITRLNLQIAEGSQ